MHSDTVPDIHRGLERGLLRHSVESAARPDPACMYLTGVLGVNREPDRLRPRLCSNHSRLQSDTLWTNKYDIQQGRIKDKSRDRDKEVRANCRQDPLKGQAAEFYPCKGPAPQVMATLSAEGFTTYSSSPAPLPEVHCGAVCSAWSSFP